jgi:hypothetical protein
VNPELAGVAEHMRELGLGSMQHALRLSLYDGMTNDWWGELSVLHAAHAAEILIKARIAQEHPLLIFEQLPKPSNDRTSALELHDLFEKGRTVQFGDLPERLWATTGVRLPSPDVFASFGRFRNSIQHFGAPDDDSRQRTLDFIFGVVDPFIHAEWDLFALDYNEECGYDHYEHILETLVSRNIRPRISPDAARVWASPEYRPGRNAPPGYATWFEQALKEALPKEAAPEVIKSTGKPRRRK